MNTNHIPGLFSLSFGELPDMLTDRSVAFVTDARLAGLEVVAPVMAAVSAEPVVIPVGEPNVETVDAVARRLADVDVDTVVAFGGGSVIDTVKLASVTATSDTSCVAYLGAPESLESGLDVLAVPTTSGSGAEVTRTCVVSRNGRKSWAWHERLRPRRVLVDPTLTLGLPGNVTIATGLDALVHALEAATAPMADSAAIASGSAAIEVILECLPAVVADAGDRAARAEMLDAALCAGFAIDRAGTGLGHAVGHAVASMTTIPHGLAVAFGMWSCLEWGMEAAAERYRRVDSDGSLHRKLGAALDAIDFERELRRWAETALDPGGFAVELAREEHRPMCLNNARPVDGDDIVTVSHLVCDAWNAMHP